MFKCVIDIVDNLMITYNQITFFCVMKINTVISVDNHRI